MWYNNYVGIPYQDKGRDRTGIDCWGLVRLVYIEQYNITLPSFIDSYENDVAELIEQAVNANKESWHLASEPKTGDVVLFNILGHASHLGVYVGNGYFLHASEGARQAVIEKLSHPSWSRRLQGFYRYRESAEALITGHAHPLRREIFAQTIQAGTSAREIVTLIQQQHEIYTETETECLLFINGVRILEKDFDATIIKADDKIEYRSLVKGSRSILTLALLAATLAFGPGLGATFQTAATGVTTTVGGSITVAGVTTATATVSAGWAAAGAIAINVAGTLLINQIAPIRQPKDTDPGQPQSADLFSGGSNPLQPYSTIPVVLGTMRYTPPLGAQQVVEFEDVSKSRLNTLVVWGFGPLEIQDIQIGTKSLSEFTDNPKLITYSGKANENPDVTDEIYKSDIKQATIGSPIVLQNLAPGSLEADGETNPAVLRNQATVDITQEVDKLKIAIHFPEGLRTVIAKGNDAGKSLPAQFDATYSYQKLDANLNLVGSEISNTAVVGAYTWQVGPQFVQELYAGGEGPEYYADTSLYRWIGVFLLPDNSVTLSYGAPTLTANSPQMELSLAERIYASSYSSVLLASDISSVNRSITPPTPALDAVELYRFRVYGFQGLVENSIQNFTTGFVSTTGLNLTITGPSSRSTGRLLTVSLTAGTAVITPGLRGLIELGDDGQEYYKRKDAFTYVQELTVEKSRYRIKIQRNSSNYTNSDLTGGLEPVINSDQEVAYKRYNKAFLYAVTGYSTDTKPINTTAFSSIGVSIAKTALSILSNKNLNGNLEGINGLVTSICRDYDTTIQSWDNLKATNNPASLFLHVLTHPANAYRVKPEDEATQINFAELAVWWQYCLNNGFTYNNVVTSTVSVLDILKDIAAAGRASPTVIDGKWSVIIDKPRSIVTQYFTPNNSWGFEGSKALPTQPHAFRINFRNEAKAYQDDSIIVPNAGYTINTASVIEEISIPGITNSEAAKKHAQWHLAQIKLRPEVYTINTDIEYLVCTRGDLVRVSHDIPRWGTGTGRIKTVTVAGGVIIGVELDNAIYLETTKTYKILVRTEANQTVERTVQAPATTDYHTSVTFTQTLALNTIKPQELFILGEVGQETQELIVLGIEPQPNYTAKIVLTDYSPEIYTINFDADYPQIVYNTNYTKPPKLLVDAIASKPVINKPGQIVSDESVLTRTASGALISNIRIAPTNPELLEDSVFAIEVEYDFANSAGQIAQFRKTEPLTNANIILENVVDGDNYKIRARYVSNRGLFGLWTDYVEHTVIGKTSPPANIVSATTELDIISGLVKVSWTPVTDLDLNFYEVRTQDAGWGTDTGYVFRGIVTNVSLPGLASNVPTNYYIRAYDIVGTYSVASALATITIQTPSLPTNITFGYSVNSNSSSLLNIAWAKPLVNQLQAEVKHYEVELAYTQPITRTITTTVTSPFWQIESTWQGTATFRIRTVDTLNNVSAWSSNILIVKNAPQNITTTSATPNLNILELSWLAAEKTTLPVAGYELRESNSNWGSSTNYIWKGSATKTLVDMTGKAPGSYTWYLKAFDVENQYASQATQITYVVQAPNSPVVSDPVFQDTSLTAATFTLNWSEVAPAFGLAGYKITYTYTKKTGGTELVEHITKATTITLPANWLGTVNVSVKAIDNIGNESAAAIEPVIIQNPNPIIAQTYTAQVIDNNVLLYWSLPAITTLPISHVRIKRSSTSIDTWSLATLIGDKDGTFTSFSEQVPGTYRYWIAAVDTEGNESTSQYITVDVSEPPNYVFIAEKTSRLSDKVLDLDDETALDITNTPSNITPVVNPYITTVGSVAGMSQTTAIPARTVVGVFVSSNYQRFVSTKQRVDLSNLDTVYIATNKGGGGWGETPDSGENLVVEYSTDNTVWITMLTVIATSEVGNSWSIKTITLPAGAKGVTGVYLRIRQLAFSPNSNFDTWAFTSIYTHSAIEDQTSTNNTLRNAQLVSDGIILPVDNEETWQSHFTSKGWTTPQDQVTAGYPIFIQPADFGFFGLGYGSFTEIFDFGNTLTAGVQIGLTLGRQLLAGIEPIVRYEISTSLDKITWTTPVINSDFILTQQNFRYVKVFVSVQAINDNDLYKITRIKLKLDTKKINNSGTATTAANGRANINFSKAFFDVTSINVTASGTEPRTVVYDFNDDIRTGTFSVSGGVCTVNTNTAHELLTGYNARLTFSGTGAIPVSKVYVVTVITTTQFTVSVDTSNNGTTGTAEYYPNSMQALVFDIFGDPVPNAQVSWYIEGY